MRSFAVYRVVTQKLTDASPVFQLIIGADSLSAANAGPGCTMDQILCAPDHAHCKSVQVVNLRHRTVVLPKSSNTALVPVSWLWAAHSPNNYILQVYYSAACIFYTWATGLFSKVWHASGLHHNTQVRHLNRPRSRLIRSKLLARTSLPHMCHHSHPL